MNLRASTSTTTINTDNNLFAAVDMGTNSFKLLIVRADPSNGRFLTLDHRKEPVVLGHDATTLTDTGTSTSISSALQLRAIYALSRFQRVLHAHCIPSSRSRLVATSAIREASNQSDFIRTVQQTFGLQVDVLSGLDEARLTYLGVLQFYPVHQKTVLTVDIGGGSTEFAIGKEGKLLMGISLKLGHITLTQDFVTKNEICQMRDHIKTVIQASGLITKVKEHLVDKVIGSSGTIRAIEKAVSFAYANELGNNAGIYEGYSRDWRFSREELGKLVNRLCQEERGEEEKVRKEGFFKRRAEFIVAGAILLEEIFVMLGIEEMEVSGYSLAEGVIAENLAEVLNECDIKVNARWRSVVKLSTRFNNKKMIRSAALCAGIAKEIFEGLRRWNGEGEGYCKYELLASLDDKDLEYLEAACLLHKIGLYTGKKGYHKQSYHLILNGDHLHGYDNEEVKLIALLARYHRKKFPKLNHASLQGFTEKVRQKFRFLCTIIRVSAALVQCQSVNAQNIKFSHSSDGFKLQLMYQPLLLEEELRKELEYFELVFQQRLSIIAP